MLVFRSWNRHQSCCKLDLLQPVGFSTGAEGAYSLVHVRPLQSGDEGAVVPPLQLPSSAHSWAELRRPEGSACSSWAQPYRAREEATAIHAHPVQQVPNANANSNANANENVPRLELLESSGGLAVEAKKLPGAALLLGRVPGARTAGVTKEPLDADESAVPLSPLTVPYCEKLREERRPPGAHILSSLTDELDVVARRVVRPSPSASSSAIAYATSSPSAVGGPAAAVAATSATHTYIYMQTLSPAKPSRYSRPPPYQPWPPTGQPATGLRPPPPSSLPTSSALDDDGDVSNTLSSIRSGLQRLEAESLSPRRPGPTQVAASQGANSQSLSQNTNPYTYGTPYGTQGSSSNRHRTATRISPRTAPIDAGACTPAPPEGSTSL